MSWTDQALSIRNAAEAFLVDTCNIRKFNGYGSVDGEYTESFSEIVNVPCRLINQQGTITEKPNAQEHELQLLISTNVIKIQLPYAVEITEKDKIVFNSVTYDVTYVPAKHSLMGAFVVQLEKKK